MEKQITKMHCPCCCEETNLKTIDEIKHYESDCHWLETYVYCKSCGTEFMYEETFELMSAIVVDLR